MESIERERVLGAKKGLATHSGDEPEPCVSTCL